MYHSKKSDSLNKFRQIQGAVEKLMKSDRNAMAFDLFVVINAFANRKSIMYMKRYLNNPKDAQDLIL